MGVGPVRLSLNRSRFLPTCVLIAACSCGGARVTVRNDTSTPVEDVTVAAKGARAIVGRIHAGGDRSGSLCPSGEAGSLDVSFRAGSEIHRGFAPVYFECDWAYLVRVRIAPDLTVTAESALR